MEPEISLLCKDLVKTYPGVIAMDHINFELRKGCLLYTSRCV